MNKQEKVEKYVDRLKYRTNWYLASGTDIAFKQLFDEMRDYYAFIHGETCPFHLLEKVKKKGD
jgi:hypothetical protein